MEPCAHDPVLRLAAWLRPAHVRAHDQRRPTVAGQRRCPTGLPRPRVSGGRMLPRAYRGVKAVLRRGRGSRPFNHLPGHSGSTLEDRGDHLLVRTPHNPEFHWGNCLLVMDEDAVDDAGRWVGTFQSAFPEATWVAIGLTRMPDDQDAWAGQGLELELDDVLTTRTVPRQTPLPEGYAVRRLSGEDRATD